jgi:hypothetical protein
MGVKLFDDFIRHPKGSSSIVISSKTIEVAPVTNPCRYSRLQKMSGINDSEVENEDRIGSNA